MDRQTKENHNTFKHFEEVSLILVQTIDCIQKMDIAFRRFMPSRFLCNIFNLNLVQDIHL